MYNEEFIIQEDKPDHHYRTEIPNIIVDMVEMGFLNHYDFIVYSVLKRICGDSGKSTYSIPNLAKKCGFSVDKTRECIKKLEHTIPLINCPLICIRRSIKQDGSHCTLCINITNIWRKNGDFYRDRKELKKSLVVAENDQGGSCQQPGGSWEPHKEELVKKNYMNKELASESASDLKKILSEIPMRVIEDGIGKTVFFTAEEIHEILDEFSEEIIRKAGTNVYRRKNNRKHPILNEKGYFIDNLRKVKQGVYK